MRVALFFLACLSLSAGQQAAPTDSMDDFNEGFVRYLRVVLENLKANMDKGIPELKIPPLDPLSINEKITINAKESGKLEIRDLKVTGLKTSEIKDIKADLNALTASFDIKLGKVSADGMYDANLLIAKLFPITGHGKLLSEFQQVSLHAKVNLESPDLMHFKCIGIDFDVKVSSSKIYFENIIDPKLAPVINKILSGLTPVILNTVMPKTKHHITPHLIRLINKELTKLDIAELIKKFKPKMHQVPMLY